MTVLIGVLCSDGVVIGSDSSATFTAGQQRTIEQPCKKIKVIKDSILVAGTGEIGLGQRFSAVVETAFTNSSFSQNSPIEISKQLCSAGVNDFLSTKAPAGSYGALVGFLSNKKPNLCEFSLINFQPELKTPDIWYVSMGSGQNIADPFLGFIRKNFWENKMPKCQDAIFAVAWTLEHVIDLNPGGIKGPVQISVLNPEATPKARILLETDLVEHYQNIEGIGEYLRKYKDSLTGKVGTITPVPKAP